MEISNIKKRIYRLFTGVFLLSLLCNRTLADNPVLSKIEGGDLTYHAGSNEIKVSESLNIIYKERNLTSAAIRIAGGYEKTEDVLTIKSPGDFSVNWDESTGTLMITGKESVSKYEKALHNIYYKNSASSPAAGTRAIHFTVYDDDKSSNSLARNIVVISDEPTPEPPPPTSSPTASISGDASICFGESAELQVNLTGMPPWSIVVLNGTTQKVIGNIRTTVYKFKVQDPGTYTLKSMRDAKSGGKVSGSATVNQYPTPTAVISGDVKICDGSEATITVTFTGTMPWNFSYRIDNNDPVTVNNVMQNPYNLIVKQSGTYTLTEVSDKNCTGTVSGTAKVSIATPPVVSISGLKSEYSQESDEWIQLYGTPSGGTFSGIGVIPYNNNWYFLPGLAAVGINLIVYKYGETEGCLSYDTAAVNILEYGAEILIENQRTMICNNDAPLQIQGRSLLGGGNGSFIINGGNGLTDHGNNTATLFPNELEPRKYTITYTTVDGNSISKDIEIGKAIHADFKWTTQCYQTGQPIVFTSTSSSEFGNLTDSSYFWRILENNYTDRSPQNFTYTFANTGKYTVELVLQNSYGCKDTATKTLPLEPLISLSGQPYFESFVNENSAWHTASSGPVNNWTLGNGLLSDATDGHAWYTNLKNSPAPQEHSWIIGPCFSFTGTSKPVLIAQIQRFFTDNRDGVHIEYSIDNGMTWNLLGELDDGLNWYNGNYGNTTDLTPGWTNIKDSYWIESRHALDFLAGQPLVQFRIMYEASGTAENNKGFAVDNIRIAERNRMTLVEHFTNTSDDLAETADAELDDVAGTYSNSLIDIQYHTSIPAGDPFFNDNPVVPINRQLYYGLSAFPYAVINGGVADFQRIDYKTTHLNEKSVMLQSLYDSDFRMEIQTMERDSYLIVLATVTALQNVPLSELSVKLAVIEEEVSEVTGSNGDNLFRNVVKDMLPGAAGSTYYKTWSRNDSVQVWQKWKIENVYNPDKLRVVGFIQNESNKEIYQSALDVRGIITGNNHSGELNAGDLIMLYPNPAHDKVDVILNNEKPKEATIEFYSNLGKLIYSTTMAAGSTRKEIPISQLPSGVYMIRILRENKTEGTAKLVITR